MDKRIDIRADVVYDDIIILPVEGEVEITENGVHDVAQYETANVNVPTTNPEPLSVTENGTYTAPEGKSYSPVTVAVPEIELIPLMVDTNPYMAYAPEGKGYSPVTVNIPFSGTLDIYENGVHLCEGYAAVNVMVPETELVPLSATENKTYTPPSGKGFFSVTVDVPPAIELIPLTVESNGSVYVAPEGKGYSPVTVDIPLGGTMDIYENGGYSVVGYSGVNVMVPQISLIPELNVSQNGTYTAPTGEAYSEVTVDVKSYAEETLLWENPSPTSAVEDFVEDVGVGSVDAYDYYKIVMRQATFNDAETSFLIEKPKASTSGHNCALVGGGLGSLMNIRPMLVSYQNKTTVRFSSDDCRNLYTSEVRNNRNIPIRIYGVVLKGQGGE